MIKNYLIDLIKTKFEYTPTLSQSELINKLAEFILSEIPDEIFLLNGYAGTGKTTLISALILALDEIKRKSVLLAPTGRAAKLLASYSGKPAYTIHKKIYRQKSSSDAFGKFVLDKNLYQNTIFVIDESSMISNVSFEQSVFGSGKLLSDLLEYVYTGKNCKIILMGDSAQLPPVGINISPALDTTELESMGFKVIPHTLTEVIRQAFDSGILFNATYIRELIQYFQQNIDFPKFEINKFSDIIRINGSELIEAITNSYEESGFENTIIITRSNKRAIKYNEGVRKSILWRESEISVGDLLMVVKNNYFWLKENEQIDFIANGEIVEIIKIQKFEELYGFRFADISVRLINYDNLIIDTKIILDAITSESPSLSQEQNKDLFFAVAEDFIDIKSKKTRYNKVKENPYFNALQVKFSYAITCHKSQGGQWKNVFLDQEYVVKDMLNVEYLRWLYTAVTRCSDKLFLVNFKDDFFR